MDEYKSEEKLNEDRYILDERKFYLDLQVGKKESIRKDIKDRILDANSFYNRNLTEEKPGGQILETVF